MDENVKGAIPKNEIRPATISPPTTARATYSRARYSYNELDQMTKIEHFNSDNDGGARQDRTFVYDGYARLQSETTPETGTTGYEYWSNDLPKKKTDARGIYATLSYDARKLLTDVDYSDATRDVHYDYGAYGERTLMQPHSACLFEITRFSTARYITSGLFFSQPARSVAPIESG